jgi:hypothetical protein
MKKINQENKTKQLVLKYVTANIPKVNYSWISAL